MDFDQLLDSGSDSDGSGAGTASDDEAYAQFVATLQVGAGPGERSGHRNQASARRDGSDSDDANEWENVPRTSFGNGVLQPQQRGRQSARLPVRTLGGGRLKALPSVDAERAAPERTAAATEPQQPVDVPRTGSGDTSDQETRTSASPASTRPHRAAPAHRVSLALSPELVVALAPKDRLQRRAKLKQLIANLAQRIMAWPEVTTSGAPHPGTIGAVQTPPPPSRANHASSTDAVADDEGADVPSRRKARKLAEKLRVQQAKKAAPKKVNCLLALHQLAQDGDGVVARLALLSQAAVFKDILPDFRVRLPTEKETMIRVSRAVKEQRNYDAALLSGYQRFLKLLEAVARTHDVSTGARLSTVALKCMGELAAARPHFNFGSNLVAALARHCSDPYVSCVGHRVAYGHNVQLQA